MVSIGHYLPAAARLITALLVVLLPALPCAGDQKPAGGGFTSIRVVMDDNYPPYVFKGEQGELRGIVIDQWRLWEKKTGIRAELSGMDWGEAQRRMQAGEFDVIDTIFKTERREVYLDFARPYARIDFSIFLHNDISGIRDATDLKGFLVGVKSGGAVIDILKNYGVENIDVYPSDLSIVEAARDSKIKVFVMGDQSALYFLNKLQIAGDFRHSTDVFSAEFHRAVPKGRGELLDAVEKGFTRILPAEYEAIEKEWLGTSLVNEFQLRYFWYAAAGVSVVGAAVIGWVVLLRRVVKRKTEELTKSEANYRSIIENLQDVYYRSDAEGRLVMISPSGAGLIGYDSTEQMLGQLIRDTFYFDPEERDAFLHNLKLKGHLYGYEVTLKRKDGSPLPVATSTHLMYDSDGAFVGVEGVFRDISQQKQDMEALDYINQCFQQALNSPQHMLYRLNVKKGCYDYMSPVFERITGHPLEQFMQTSLDRLAGYFHPDDRERIFGLIEEKISEKSGNSFNLDIEYRFRRADGSYCWLHDSNTACFDGRGELECFFGAAHDITERKRTEELLRESEERYRQLVEQSTAWIWKTDSQLRHIFSNDNVERILGYSAREICSVDILQLVHPDDHDALKKTVEDAVSKRRGWSSLVLRWLRRDGSWRFVESSGGPVFDQDDRFVGLQGVDTDITARLQLEQERDKAQRLESLGLLAGGIAHDFNNILTGIVGNLSLARMMIDSDHRAKRRLDECEKAARRASELTQQLLTFARGGEPVRKAVVTARLLNESLSFGLRGSNVKGVLELAGGLWPLDADEGQINQVLNNLLINASQAMPNGGTVTLRAENVESGEPSGRFVRIWLRDTGVGMSADTISQVFDPYFTTKPGGTGLGLASVYSIVTRHGGTVTVSSQPGCGTEFVITLPATAEKPTQAQGDTAPCCGSCIAERVLVMDDEEMILDVATLMLGEQGCAVDTCNDGAEAVERYRAALEQGTPYDAVILDLTVPGGMGGLEASRLIRAMDPLALLIVSSGYSSDSVMAEYPDHGFCGAIMKPYTIESLTNELGRVITERRLSAA